MGVHDLLRDPQSQTAAISLGGKVRLENPVLILGRDSIAIVDELDGHVGLARRRTHNHMPSFGCSLQGIDDQIDERLGQLIGVGFNPWQRVTKLHGQIDAPALRPVVATTHRYG